MALTSVATQTIRRLLRTPLFTAVILLTLAVGIGANTAIFSVVYGVLLKPLPYSDANRLAGVWQSAPQIGIEQLNASPSEYLTLRQEGHTLERVGLYQPDSVSISGIGEPEQIDALDVTEDVLPLLRIQPALGRLFNREDAQPGRPDTIMLSYGYWRKRFGGSRDIVGRRLIVDGKARTVIGVLPAGARMPLGEAQLLTVFQFDPAQLKLGNFSYRGIARLKPGVTFAQANADLERIYPIMFQRFAPPAGFTLQMFTGIHMKPDIHPLKEDVVGNVGPVLWVVMAVVGIVLLIACANVANLLLVRVDGRQQELAVRMALGAGKTQLAGELLVESLILAVAGGALGIALGSGVLQLLIAIGPGQLPRLQELKIDAPVLLFTVAISLLGGLVFGAVPVLRYAGSRINASLRQGGRTMSEGRERHRVRAVLVVLQVGLALVLLVSSGLMIRTFQAMHDVQPGFTDPRHLLTFELFIPDTHKKTGLEVARQEQAVFDKLAQIPGVSAVSATSSIPMGDSNSSDPVFSEDKPEQARAVTAVRRYNFIAPGYFQTMGNHLVAGRDLTWAEVFGRRPVALVSASLAKLYWGRPDAAIGKRIRNRPGAPWREVIGVAADDYELGVDKPPTVAVFWPILMDDFWDTGIREQRFLSVVVRSSRVGTISFFNAVQRAVWSLDSALPLANPRTMQQIYDGSMARTSFTMVMLLIAAGMALVLGLVGIYGVISYSVSQRTREIGIRMALGAQKQTVAGMFVRHALVLVIIGLVCGTLVAASVTRFMQGLLYETSPLDPYTFLGVALVLMAAGGAASYVPARRASAVDPIQSLRGD